MQLQPADAGAGEAHHLVAEVVEHHADLALEAHFQHDVRPVGGVEPRAFSASKTFLGHHAFDQFRHHFGSHRLIDDDFVFLLSPLARMNQPVREIPTVGEEDEAFAFFVETADVMQVLILQRQQVVNRHPLMRVATGTEVALRLVQGEDNRRFGTHRRTIDDHFVVRLHLGGQFGDDMTIDRHTSTEDDFLRPTP